MKTLFVTGATKNTGWAIARRFAAQGWNAVVSSRSAEAAAEAAAKLVERLGGTVVKMVFLIELVDLGGRAKLAKYPVDGVLAFPGH